MKQNILYVLTLALALSSCITHKKAQRDLDEFYANNPAYDTNAADAEKDKADKSETEEIAVVKQDVTPPPPPPAIPEPEEKKPTVEEVLAKPIVVKTENVKVVKGEDIRKMQYHYFVIIGSFSIEANAVRYKKNMTRKGFLPTVLENTDTGLYRVSVFNSNSKEEARQLIQDIRTKYEEHRDVWLLHRE